MKKAIKENLLALGLIFAGVLVLVLWSLGPGFLTGSSVPVAYDYFTSGHMTRDFMAQWVKRGLFPFWDPLIFAGMPSVASLHGELLYPTFLARLALPGWLVFNWHFLLHYVLGGFLMYLYVKNRLKASWGLSTLMGLSYALTPTLASLIFAGHDTKLLTLAWVPGAFYALELGAERGSLWPFAVLGLIMGVAFGSGHSQLAYYLYLGLGLYFLFLLAWSKKDGAPWAGLAKRAGYFGLAVALSLGIAAIQFLPTYYYSGHWSPRVQKGYQYAVSWSLPWVDFLGAFVAGFGGFLEKYWAPIP